MPQLAKSLGLDTFKRFSRIHSTSSWGGASNLPGDPERACAPSTRTKFRRVSRGQCSTDPAADDWSTGPLKPEEPRRVHTFNPEKFPNWSPGTHLQQVAHERSTHAPSKKLGGPDRFHRKNLRGMCLELWPWRRRAVDLTEPRTANSKTVPGILDGGRGCPPPIPSTRFATRQHLPPALACAGGGVDGRRRMGDSPSCGFPGSLSAGNPVHLRPPCHESMSRRYRRFSAPFRYPVHLRNWVSSPNV